MEHYVKFHNGQKMPLLGLGTWQATDSVELEEAMNAALEAGYRHFDTAYMYNNESQIGDVIKKWIDAGKVKREELFIVTKVLNDSTRNLPLIGLEESRVEHFMKLSLTALKLDYVDLYLIHFPVGLKYVDDVTIFPRQKDNKEYLDCDMTTDLVKVWKAMEAQVEAGRTKSIGLSNFNESQIERIVAVAQIKPANLQVEANVYFQQKSLRSTCAKHEITFCAYSPFGSPGRPPTLGEFVDPGILTNPLVTTIGQSHGKTPAQVLLRFFVQQDIVVIPKSTNKKRLTENSGIFDFIVTPTEMTQLEGLDKGDAGRLVRLGEMKGLENHPERPY